MRYLILAILDFGNTHKANLRKEYMLEAYRVWTLALTHFSFLLVQKDLIRFQSTLLEYPHKTSFLNLLSTKEKKGKKEKRKRKWRHLPPPQFQPVKKYHCIVNLVFSSFFLHCHSFLFYQLLSTTIITKP